MHHPPAAASAACRGEKRAEGRVAGAAHGQAGGGPPAPVHPPQQPSLPALPIVPRQYTKAICGAQTACSASANSRGCGGSRLLDHIDVILQRLPLGCGADQGLCAACHAGAPAAQRDCGNQEPCVSQAMAVRRRRYGRRSVRGGVHSAFVNQVHWVASSGLVGGVGAAPRHGWQRLPPLLLPPTSFCACPLSSNNMWFQCAA